MNNQPKVRLQRHLFAFGLLLFGALGAASSIPPIEHFSKFDEIFSVRISPGGE